MRNYSAKDVDAYIAGSDKKAQPTLREIRKVIKATIPKVEEQIRWGVPFYRYHGLLAGFAVFKKHATFGLAFVFPKEDRAALEKEGYATGSKTVRIQFDQKVPGPALRKILKAKARSNEAKKAKA